MSLNLLLKIAAAGATLLSASPPAFAVPVPGPVGLDVSQLFLERALAPLEARAAGGGLACHSITAEEFQKFSGWGKVRKYAEETWGSSDANYGANPSQYPDSSLRACTKGPTVPITFSEPPRCNDIEADLRGSSVGTDSAIEYTVKQDASSLTVGAKFSITVTVPGVTGTAETSIGTTITNERSSSFETSEQREEQFKITLKNDDGKQCSVKQATKTCSATGKGDASIVAEGFFWFFFREKREVKGHPEYGSHYHWAANIAEVLNEEERTTHMMFQGPVSVKSSTVYDTNCHKIESKKV
ncbi:hypothetical protein BKA70DRAFT_1360300 [Coprinopsis sp. MPI-PUGE-AT-0042]|nr:hypothetical protein BKA70DRAFT_1360300 [Coprinopsis sp. MPI-PUGE-AT-0042]